MSKNGSPRIWGMSRSDSAGVSRLFLQLPDPDLSELQDAPFALRANVAGLVSQAVCDGNPFTVENHFQVSTSGGDRVFLPLASRLERLLEILGVALHGRFGQLAGVDVANRIAVHGLYLVRFSRSVVV